MTPPSAVCRAKLSPPVEPLLILLVADRLRREDLDRQVSLDIPGPRHIALAVQAVLAANELGERGGEHFLADGQCHGLSARGVRRHALVPAAQNTPTTTNTDQVNTNSDGGLSYISTSL